MRTENQLQTPRSADSAEPTIVDLEAREAPRAEDVKGGCTPDYCRYLGSRTGCPRTRRW